MKKAFITGITGQDGSYLAELLLAKGYAVHGLVRRASAYNRSRIDHLRTDENLQEGRLVLHYGELNDLTSFHRLLHKIDPAEIYHLAGQSHVGLSFELPEVTCLENGMATLHLLEAMREMGSDVRLFIAASSEIFGSPLEGPQNELTPMNPVNPYGVAKTMAVNLGRVYRKSHGLFVSIGIAYNHESPRRGENFVTRKIASSVAAIAKGASQVLELGNLDGRRDWGYAPEYVDCMWRSLQPTDSQDYIIATGQTYTVREFVDAAFIAADIAIEWEGRGTTELARRQDSGEVVLRVVDRFFRPVDASKLWGDPAKAAATLDWQATVKAPQLAQIMVESEMKSDC
ncbi:MAG: GDP-mannose 4,6-dehydratase [Synoicihabitans sp.]